MVNQLVLIEQAAAYFELLLQAFQIYPSLLGVRPATEIFCMVTVSIITDFYYLSRFVLICLNKDKLLSLLICPYLDSALNWRFSQPNDM